MNKKFLAIPLVAVACLGGLLMTASECKALDDELDENGTQVPHTHSYVESTVTPTCTHGGYVLHKCACGDEYKTDEVEKTAHNYVNYVCSVCGTPDPDAPVTDGFIFAPVTDDGTETGNVTAYSVIGVDLDAYGAVEVVIPKEHNGKPVTRIHKNAFSGQSKITGVELPETITEIDDCAFSNCYSLERVQLNEGLKSIAQHAFWSCNMLKQIHFPSTLTTIGQSAFAYSGLESVSIPAATNQIQSNPFYGSTSLKEITVESGNTAFYSDGNCVVSKYGEVVIGCKNSVIPADESVRAIGFAAFQGIEFNGTLPDNITEIASWAFANGQGGVILPQRLTLIGDYAFNGRQMGNLIIIPASVIFIGSFAFESCGLDSVVFGNPYDDDYLNPENQVRLERIEDFAFANNYIINFVIPASVNHVGNDIFHLTDPNYGRYPETVVVEDVENWQFELYSEQTNYLYVDITPSLLENPEDVALYFSEDVNVWAKQIITSDLPSDVNLISYRIIKKI